MKYVVLTLFMIPFLFQSKSDTVYEPSVVLELFTSQGCSSCPPADALLEEVKSKFAHKGVIVVSYHVDYWNYIGWKDPFSKASYSEKQRRYGNKFNNSSIYTPQVVVNGKEHFVGSKANVMNAKLKEYLNKTAENKLTLSNTKKTNGKVEFNYELEGSMADKRLRTILVIDELTTKVTRGENRNRTLKNSNIVVEENYFEINSAKGKGSILIPDFINQNDQLSLIVVVENKNLDITTGSLVQL